MIPMVDLVAQYDLLREEIEQAIATVLQSGQYILGAHVRAFEEEAAAYLGARHAIGVGSGTEALHLALIAAGVGPNDEVITTPFTFIATAEAICYTGAKPVFVDIDVRTFTIDPELIERAITPATKALLPVHLFGQATDMDKVMDICQRYQLMLIEDCAQSFGAAWRGRMTGTFGGFGCFSFFPSKNLGAYGDGGLIVTDSDASAERLRALRNHGSRQYAHHNEIGFNSRLDELQAAVLRIKLNYIDAFNAARRRVAQHYNRLLQDLPLTAPYEDPTGRHVYHQYTLLSARRDAVREALHQAGIASAIYYPLPVHRQPVFAKAYAYSSLPVAETIARQCLSLPVYPELSEGQIERVAGKIRSVLLG